MSESTCDKWKVYMYIQNIRDAIAEEILQLHSRMRLKFELEEINCRQEIVAMKRIIHDVETAHSQKMATLTVQYYFEWLFDF